MRLSDAKTKDEFWRIADIWYQRTLNLSDIFHDVARPNQYRKRAFYLWRKMANRMIKLNEFAVAFNQFDTGISPGGVIVAPNK